MRKPLAVSYQLSARIEPYFSLAFISGVLFLAFRKVLAVRWRSGAHYRCSRSNFRRDRFVEIDTQSAATRTTSLAVFATDGELLMRFRRHRDEQAFAEVVERHGRLVWIVCKQALQHHQDVEDAFQATFLILAQRATTIRASDSAAAWLYRVAQRTAIAARRKRSRRREEELIVEPPQGEEALPVIHDRQMLYVLMEELRALPERYQTPLVMRYFEGQSRRAIAEQTDSTLAQIQGRLVRGRRMLRSRLVRRGVSLSLAAGAVATASTAASAAVSPSVVAATAASSTQFIHSGAAGGASPAAQELARQGVKVMWYASLTKSSTVVATLIVGLGVAWAAGQPGSGDSIASDVQVDLGQSAELVAATSEDEEAAPAVEITAASENVAEAEPAPETPVKYDVVDLSPARQLELERDHWLLKAKAYRLKAERMRAMAFHGTGRPDNTADTMLMDADANLAEAKSIELARQMTGGNAGAGELREQPLKNLDQRKAENESEIAKLEDTLVELRIVDASRAAQLEVDQMERALLQRELEHLHGNLLQLNSESSPAQVEARQQQMVKVREEIAQTHERLRKQVEETLRAAAEHEVILRKVRSTERQLEYLDERNLQLTYAQEASTDDPIGVRRLKSMVTHLENELAAKDAQLMARAGTSNEAPLALGATALAADSVLKPGDTIRIIARGVSPDEPIVDDHRVEAMGTVALGPTSGRVKVAGLTILEAEEAIKKHLAEKFENPVVQVTMERQIEPVAVGPAGVPVEPSRYAPNQLTVEQLKEAFTKQLAVLQESLAAVQRENAELKRQIEELRKEHPAATDPSVVK